MKQIIFTALVALSLLGTPVIAGDLPSQKDIKCPITLEVTGTVIIKNQPKGKKLKNASIVNDAIWWEGDTKKLRLKDGGWVTLKLLKVEQGKAIFELRGRRGRPPHFQVKIKQSENWGLTKKKAAKKTN